MVTAIRQFEYGMTTIEVVAFDQAGGLELGQYAVDGGQAHVLTGFHQSLVHILGAHVALSGDGRIEHLQNLHTRQGDLEAGLAQFAVFNHGLLSRGCCFAAPVNAGMIGV